jgi:hypothetical protein
MTFMRSTFGGNPGHTIVVEKARALGHHAAQGTREAAQEIMTTEHGLMAKVRTPRSEERIAAVRIVASGGTVVLFLYLVYVLVDSATRGRFRGVAFTVAAVAFVGSCVAVVRLS